MAVNRNVRSILKDFEVVGVFKRQVGVNQVGVVIIVLGLEVVVPEKQLLDNSGIDGFRQEQCQTHLGAVVSF